MACTHMYATRGTNRGSMILEQYTKAIKLLTYRNHVGARKEILQCNECAEIGLSRSFLCLECDDISCFSHAKKHYKKHQFGVDTKTGHIYCFSCASFIHDSSCQNARINAESYIKKKRYVVFSPTKEEMSMIRENGKAPPINVLRGILNLGATCFLSVILQTVLLNPILRNYFLSDLHSPTRCINKYCLACELVRIFNEFYGQDKPVVAPTHLLSAIWHFQKGLAGYAQQDAHEFMILLFNQLHNSLTDDGSTQNCNCIFHSTFGGVLTSSVKCSGCKNVNRKEEPYLDISLDLKGKNGEALTTLMQCIERFSLAETLSKDQYRCNNCHNATDATKQMRLKSLPPVICFQLKRFDQHIGSYQKLDRMITFPTEIDMSKYVPKKGKDIIYDLFGVIIHEGKVDTGHYTCYIKLRHDWYHFNDHIVELAKESVVLQSKAYLLLYMKRIIEYKDDDKVMSFT